MAYNTKAIKTDKDGNPISQYYNPEIDEYEPVQGAGGGNAVILYNEDGTENNNLSLIPILDKLSQLTGTVIDEETRKSNELERIDNEDARQSNEDMRHIYEAERIMNEDVRRENENIRESNEQTRQQNEQIREQGENERIQTENERIQAENTRIENENERKSNEQIRQQKEDERQQNEITRQTNEQTRQQNEQQRTDLYNALKDLDVSQYELRLQKLEHDTSVEETVVEEAYEPVISLPENVVNGQINEIKIFGNTEAEEGDIKSTIAAMKIKSVGKNLFDRNIFMDLARKYPNNISIVEHEGRECAYFNGTGYNTLMNNVTLMNNFKGNTRYSITCSGKNVSGNGMIIRILYTDGTSTYLNHFPVGNFGKSTFISRQGKTISELRFIWGSTIPTYFDLNSIQVEEGTTATPYEPYKESTAYIIAKDKDNKIVNLRSLPNGTKDEIDVANRKLIKRIEVKSNITSGTIINFTDMVEGGTYFAWNENGETETGTKGDTLGIDATTLIYQLAQPIEVPVEVFGNLQSYENGTLYIDTIISKVNFYDRQEGITVTVPIKTIDTLYKVNKETGYLHPLDISQAVIAEDGLSFTHPELVDGDLVDWDYIPDIEGTNPTISMKLPTNLKASVTSTLQGVQELSSKTKNLNTRVIANRRDIYNLQDNIDRKLLLKADKDDLVAHKAEKATQEQLGHVKAGQNITIDSDGTINAKGGNVDSVNGKTGEVILSASDVGAVPTSRRVNNKALTSDITINVSDIPGLVSTKLALGDNASAAGTGSVALGNNASAIGDYSVALGNYASAAGITSVALGNNASATKPSSVALGANASAAGIASVALGVNASTAEHSSVALGRDALANNANEGILGGTGPYCTSKWKVPGSFTVQGTKNFEIPHPKPEKSATHVIRHGAVESPTPGDTLYRWKIQATKDNDLVTIDLPDYFVWLNKDVQIFVTPQGHFGNGYGDLNRETEQLEIHCQFAGEYNVLVIGTRNDNHQSVQDWDIKGVEREIGESWTGETYAFSIDEIIEIGEIKEVSA